MKKQQKRLVNQTTTPKKATQQEQSKSYLPVSMVQSATTIGLAHWSNDKCANGLATPPPSSPWSA
jgi:hypothetical protein